MSCIKRQEQGGKSCLPTLDRGEASSLCLTILAVLKIKREEDTRRASDPSDCAFLGVLGSGSQQRLGDRLLD